jgi:2-hydroxy-6-oxonona-2,4-dienedioate hydrolase
MNLSIKDTASSALTEAGTSRFIQTSKWRLHYNEAGNGPPLIMLHGSGPGATGWSNFNSNFHELSRVYRVIVLDQPGWGQSGEVDPVKDARITANTEAVKLLMDELGIGKAVLVGNSMGGMTTLAFTILHPDRISHCITMGVPAPPGPPMMFTPGGGVTEGLRILRETYIDPSPANFQRLVNIMVFDPSFATEELMQQRSRAALANRRHLANYLQPSPTASWGKEWDTAGDHLGKIKVPTLLIHGRDDRVVNVENSLRMFGMIPNSHLHVFNRCGHWAQLEHARVFNALVHAFISSN